jgi:hypothetical protein
MTVRNCPNSQDQNGKDTAVDTTGSGKYRMTGCDVWLTNRHPGARPPTTDLYTLRGARRPHNEAWTPVGPNGPILVQASRLAHPWTRSLDMM